MYPSGYAAPSLPKQQGGMFQSSQMCSGFGIPVSLNGQNLVLQNSSQSGHPQQLVLSNQTQQHSTEQHSTGNHIGMQLSHNGMQQHSGMQQQPYHEMGIHPYGGNNGAGHMKNGHMMSGNAHHNQLLNQKQFSNQNIGYNGYHHHMQSGGNHHMQNGGGHLIQNGGNHHMQNGGNHHMQNGVGHQYRNSHMGNQTQYGNHNMNGMGNAHHNGHHMNLGPKNMYGNQPPSCYESSPDFFTREWKQRSPGDVSTAYESTYSSILSSPESSLGPNPQVIHGATPLSAGIQVAASALQGNHQNQQKQARRGKIVTAASNGQLYKTKLCYYHVHGTCSWGESCHHAHSLEELKPKPDLSRTSICPKLGECNRRNCPYAHSREELKSTDCFAKTKVCFGSCENCRFGGNCRYAHSISELRQVKDLPVKIMANIKGKKKAPPLQSLKEGDAKRGIKLIHARAKGDFDSSTYGDGYIDLCAGDSVAIVKNDEDGWLYGKNFTRGTIGWFPTSFVMDEEEERKIIQEEDRQAAAEPYCPNVQ